MHRTIRALPSLAAASACLALLAGCASRPGPAIQAPPEPAAAARIEAGEPRFADQSRVSLPFVLVLSNEGREALRVESVDFALDVEGAQARFCSSLSPGLSVAPAGEARLPIEFPVDVRELGELVAGPGGPASAAWRLEAEARLSGVGGARTSLAASAEGGFPLVREPRFRIASVGIGRDILVVTNLRIGLEIENPNDFPLVFRSMDYEFHGEGRYWLEGASREEAYLPPRSTTGLSLDGTMNFANMDRRLFDLVATLQTVSYRLKGRARIATELGFLPAFELGFDESGGCAVRR